LGPNILLSTLFSNTLGLCSSLSVRDQVSHPYKTTGKITAQECYWWNYCTRTLSPSNKRNVEQEVHAVPQENN
jgi:hypothetical protein